MKPWVLRTLCVIAMLPPAWAYASDIGVTPTAVHLDKANDRATVSVVNSGNNAVIMQVEAVEWKHDAGIDQDAPTTDVVINPSVFTVPPGQAQLVRVGLRRAAQGQHEATYRIVMREVPPQPKPGDPRLSGNVLILMAVRVPIYVAPVKVVAAQEWKATQQPDGSIVASVSNEGNVHVRVANLRLRASESQAVRSEQSVAAVVFPGQAQSFKLNAGTALAALAAGPMTVEIATDQGVQTVPVTLASK